MRMSCSFPKAYSMYLWNCQSLCGANGKDFEHYEGNNCIVFLQPSTF